MRISAPFANECHRKLAVVLGEWLRVINAKRLQLVVGEKLPGFYCKTREEQTYVLRFRAENFSGQDGYRARLADGQ